MHPDLKRLDWAILKALRDRFLYETPGQGGDYWQDDTTLLHYDATFAERIRWKWEAVLSEVSARGWLPAKGAWLVDWGCGTGIASRAFLSHFPTGVQGVRLWDRSSRAMAFAEKRLKDQCPGLPVGILSSSEDLAQPFILLLSHLLGELDTKGEKKLRPLVEKASSVIWVEPGTPLLSRRLIEWRESLLGAFSVVAPCPHAGRCGLLAPGMKRHWCHHFAPPPAKVFTEGDWVRFGKELGIDLRSLPVSFVALTRTPLKDLPEKRVIGKPRLYKGYAKALVCEASGVVEKTVRERENPDLVKSWEDPGFSPTI